MKKLICSILLALMTTLSFGQNNGTIKFLGIPIDGTETQFVTKLKAKGFTYNTYSQSYKGQFNGKNVDVYIHTNHNLVDRVYVSFPPTSEKEIKNEFNRLLTQFKSNDKYADLVFNEEIDEKEDISYEITINNKRYQASFSFFDPDRDEAEMVEAVLDKCAEFFTPEQFAVLKNYAKELVALPEDQKAAYQEKMMAEMQQMGMAPDPNEEPDPEKGFRFLITMFEGMREIADGDVWFMIHESYGRYNIGLYYDNLHNQAHGEDL